MTININLKPDDALRDQLDQIIARQTETNTRLARIESALQSLRAQGVAMSKELDALQSEVAENTSVQEGAIALLNGLSAKIAELKDDPAALQALADQLDSNSKALAAAIEANTPAAA